MREPRARGREGRGEEDQGMESLFLGFDMNPKVFWMEISFSFGLGLCGNIT